jgi:SAM-dependent methyltransferase
MDMNFTGERFVPTLRGQMYYEHFHRYAVALPIAADKDVLDIASGEGYGAAFLAMTARSVIGVDIDEASVRHSAARYPAMNLSFRVGSAAQIPLGDSSIDVITSFETIEHLTEHEQMLREMTRVLRPDGRLIISSPNRLVYSDERGYTNPFHVRELYFHEFRDLLQAYFPEVHIYGQRIFAACSIHPISGSHAETRWVGTSLANESGMPRLPAPEYFLAMCGTAAGGPLPDLSTVYLDARDDLLVDIRAGGLAVTATEQAAIAATPAVETEVLAIESVESLAAAGSEPAHTDELLARMAEQIAALEAQLVEQVAATQAYRAEAERLNGEIVHLSEQCRVVETLRLTATDRGDRAERALRELRRREAEGRLDRDNLAGELSETLALLGAARSTSAAAEAELAALRTREAGFELLLVRLTGLQSALDEANKAIEASKAQLHAQQNSRSWQITAPLRKAVSLLHP